MPNELVVLQKLTTIVNLDSLKPSGSYHADTYLFKNPATEYESSFRTVYIGTGVLIPENAKNVTSAANVIGVCDGHGRSSTRTRSRMPSHTPAYSFAAIFVCEVRHTDWVVVANAYSAMTENHSLVDRLIEHCKNVPYCSRLLFYDHACSTTTRLRKMPQLQAKSKLAQLHDSIDLAYQSLSCGLYKAGAYLRDCCQSGSANADLTDGTLQPYLHDMDPYDPCMEKEKVRHAAILSLAQPFIDNIVNYEITHILDWGASSGFWCAFLQSMCEYLYDTNMIKNGVLVIGVEKRQDACNYNKELRNKLKGR